MNWDLIIMDILILMLVIGLIIYFLFVFKSNGYRFNNMRYRRLRLYNRRRKALPNSKNKYEEECRRILKNIFRVDFPTIRPNWLRNPGTGRNLELDGFNPDIETHIGSGLAFEYDGRQHVEYTSIFHRNKSDFHYQLFKDSLKNNICKSRGVVLIRVPHFIPFNMLYSYIKSELVRWCDV